MRIAIISDIHSNLAALETVLSYLSTNKVGEIYCLGDSVGYGPYPNECLELIRRKCKIVIAGNHDWGVIEKIPLKNFNKMGQSTLRWSKKRIGKENHDFIHSLPLKITDREITFVHASPLEPENWTYILSHREAKEAFGVLASSICFFGHTHLPTLISETPSVHTLKRDSRFLINVGSVGQPRDGNPRLAFGIFDTDKWSYELIRLEYDYQKTIDAINKFGLPQMLGRRLVDGF